MHQAVVRPVEQGVDRGIGPLQGAHLLVVPGIDVVVGHLGGDDPPQMAVLGHGQGAGLVLDDVLHQVLGQVVPRAGDVVVAAALAAVVLYNLISVNLAERKKELATIKVLGFFDKEVYRYIFREIDLLALMGSCVGLLLGIPLHQFIIRTVEMDQLMFIRTIAPHSYLLSVALTMIFTLVVCFVMRRHVKKISMVESMKAPE